MTLREITYCEAVREALQEEMRRDSRVILMGEDIMHWGGIGGVAKGLAEEFGAGRIIDTPISESLIAGAAIGAAIAGLRVVAEIGMAEFLPSVVDALVNNASRMSYFSGGRFQAPMVLRTACGSGGSRIHPQSYESLFAQAPGLKMVMPSSPYDAKGLLKAAIRDGGPVIFFEPQQFFSGGSGQVPRGDYLIPIGVGEVKRSGADVTVVALGRMVPEALAAADELSREGIEMEVVDPRCLAPFDRQLVLSSVRRTGRLIIAHEAPRTSGFGAEVAAIAAREAFGRLKAPIVRVAAMDVPLPLSYPLQRLALPDRRSIMAAGRMICGNAAHADTDVGGIVLD